jgi:YidC/Oxa1 family membrane protein insertase
LLYPLLRKQLHHAKAIRELQPEIKKIKAQTKGDRRKEQMMTMELYKEREIRPLASLGILVVQAVILIGLYIGLNKVIKNPQAIVSFSYPALHHLSWMQTLSHNIHRFDDTLFGFIDLKRTAINPIYWPAMALVIGSALAQFYQGRQLMPKSKDSRGLRQILREANSGKSADQQEVNTAVGRSTMYILPLFVFMVSIRFAAALPLYWLTGSVVAVWQQKRILKEDVKEAEIVSNKPVVTVRTQSQAKTLKSKSKTAKNKRRRRK